MGRGLEVGNLETSEIIQVRKEKKHTRHNLKSGFCLLLQLLADCLWHEEIMCMSLIG
jgi:hypothetical protein